MLKQLGLARNVQHSRMPKDKKCGKRPTFKLLIHLLLFFAQWPGSSGDVAAAAAAVLVSAVVVGVVVVVSFVSLPVTAWDVPKPLCTAGRNTSLPSRSDLALPPPR